MLRTTIHSTRRLRFMVLIAIMAVAITSLPAWSANTSEQEQKEKSKNSDKSAAARRWGGLSSHAREAMRAQEPLLAAADQIDKAIAELGLSGLGGIQLSVPDRAVRMYWKGHLPAPVLQSISRRLDPQVKVRVLRARYTKRELQRQAAAFRRTPQAYPGVHRVTVLPDGSGLEVGVDSAVRVRAASYFPVATRVVVEEEINLFQASSFSRQDDIPPYWGGAVVINSNTGGACSSGFAAWRRKYWLQPLSGPRPAGHDSHMLTAEHCGGAGTPWVDGGGDFMGPSERIDPSLDSVSIRTNSAPRIYDGGAQPGTEFSKPVVGLGRNWPGEWVCTSGASTGAHCGIQIISTETTFPLPGHTVYRVAIGEQVDKLAAGGPGDSGGPVFTLTGDTLGVIGVGIIIGGPSGAAYSATCPAGTTTGCAWRVYYTDLEATVFWQDLSLHTS